MLVKEEMIAECFLEIISEAKNGYVNFPLGKLYMKFNTCYSENEVVDNDMPNLIINDMNELIYQLKIYIISLLEKNTIWSTSIPYENINDYVKKQLCYLFSNATNYDFNNPVDFVKKYIKFYNDNTFDDLKDIEGIYIEQLDAELKISNEVQEGGQETPFALDITLNRMIDGELYQYHLPYVRYGISDDEEKTAYLYAIQNKPYSNLGDRKHQLKFNKDINRRLYKINKHFTDEELLKLPPSFVLTEMIFIALLKQKSIDKFQVVKQLPEKLYIKEKLYGQHQEKTRKMSMRKIQALGIVMDVDSLKHNLTTRFVNVTKRLAHHICDSICFDNEKDSFMLADFSQSSDEINNELLKEVYDKCYGVNLAKKI